MDNNNYVRGVRSRIMMPPVFSFENLYRAYLDCRKNKRNRQDAILFEMNAEENIYELSRELTEKTYRPSFSTCFVVKKPKLREIFAASFRDRIVHHLLVRYHEKIWEPAFIFHSYASRKEKGIHLAVKNLQTFLRKATLNSSRAAFCMQLDIRNFFMTIEKNILCRLISSRCRNNDILWLTELVIRHDPAENYVSRSPLSLLNSVPPHKSLIHTEKNKGLPIGNLTSQFFANIYLNSLDHFIKRGLKCRFYMRYVDDLILVSHREYELLHWKKEISRYLEKELLLELNPSGTKIFPVKHGADFLGYIVNPTYILIRKRVVNNFRAKLRDYRRKLVRISDGVEVISYHDDILENLFATLSSYMGHFRHANTYNLLKSIFEKNIWLKHFFVFSEGRLKRSYVPAREFSRLRTQYFHFLKQVPRSIIFFQVGCFYEFYGIQALKASKYFKLKMIKRKFGFRQRCGIGEWALRYYVEQAIQYGQPVAVINQTGYVAGNIAERKLSVQYKPLKRCFFLD